MSRPLERFAGMSVLVVDDSPANVALLRQVLEQHGLDRVYGETDARRAQQQLRERRPDLVLLDLHMPHVDGFAVLEQVKVFAAGDYLPVLVLTADTTTSSRDRALAQGAQDFLTKPLDITETVLRVANLLQTRQIYSTLRRSADGSAGSGPAVPDDQHTVLERIEGVLARKTIRPVYQPVVDLTTHQEVGHEALSRFPEPPPMTPDRWFTDAFTVGLGVDLEWLAATSFLDYLDQEPKDRFLAINMSPATVLNIVEHDLCSADLCPRIVIELTEHVPVEDYGALHSALEIMRSHKTRLSADDVGAGYAGFRHLIRLRPDIIKLDIALVAGIHRSREQQALTRALLAFAVEVDAQVIAEGIETQEELEVLQDLGVPWGQGYLLGRPAPLTPEVPLTLEAAGLPASS